MLTKGIIRWVTLAIINHNLVESNNYHAMSLAVEKFLHKTLTVQLVNTCVEGRSLQYPQESLVKNAGILVSACKLTTTVRFCSSPFIKITVKNL